MSQSSLLGYHPGAEQGQQGQQQQQREQQQERYAMQQQQQPPHHQQHQPLQQQQYTQQPHPQQQYSQQTGRQAAPHQQPSPLPQSMSQSQQHYSHHMSPPPGMQSQQQPPHHHVQGPSSPQHHFSSRPLLSMGQQQQGQQQMQQQVSPSHQQQLVQMQQHAQGQGQQQQQPQQQQQSQSSGGVIPSSGSYNQQLSALLNLGNLSPQQLGKLLAQMGGPSQGGQGPPPQQQPSPPQQTGTPFSPNVPSQTMAYPAQQQQASPQQQSHSFGQHSHSKSLSMYGQQSTGGYDRRDDRGGEVPNASPPPPNSSPPPPQRELAMQRGGGGGALLQQQGQYGQQQTPQQLQSPMTDPRDLREHMQHASWLSHAKQQVRESSQSGGGNQSHPPLSRVSSIDEYASGSYAGSPMSSLHTLSSPSTSSHRSVSSLSGSMGGFHSNMSSTRSHSRSISGLGALNPSAPEFNPAFGSNPNSPATSHTSPGRFMQHGRASSSTPTMGFGSSSPPSQSTSLQGRGESSGSTAMVVHSPSERASFEQQLQLLGLPDAPFDPRELDAQLARETESHAEYIYSFRVRVCQAYLDGNCPYDAYSCFQTHARQPRRRKPILQHGRFNYIPTRCRYIIEEKECPQGIHCRFSHVTEEVIYHASKFKTQLCSHPIDSEGRCAGYGAHCAKAHGPLDLRQPVFESTDESTQNKPQDFSAYVCPLPQRVLERKYFSFVYKTKRCEGFPYDCSCDGLDYHREEERRRGPLIRYAPMACPNVKPYLNAEWSKPNVDCSGRHKPKIMKNGVLVPQESDEWECEYAHTLLELMYHPQVYKTSLCDHFNEDDPSTWRCVWKRRCAHAHGKDDVRTKEEATEEWRAHLMTALPQQNAQLPAMLNRLLSAGAAALDTLSSSGLSKSAGRAGAGGGVTSPSHMTHRRSTSGLSRDGSSGNLQGIGMRQTSQSARVPQLTFAGQALQMANTNAYPQQQNEVSPRSQPLTPMQQQSRTPIMIHATGMPPQQQHGSPGQESPRSLPAAAIKVPAMTESRTPLGLSGGLGFFSGAESQLWAPSPKMQTQQLQPQAASNVQMGSQSAGLPSRQLERFVFEQPQPPQQQQQQQTVQSVHQAAAAWAVAAKLEEYESADRASQSEQLMGNSSFISSATLLSQSSSHRLLLDNSTPLSPPPPPHHPTLQISSTSPSPDSLLPTTVANTLWTSPIATAVTDEQRATVHAANSPPPGASQSSAVFRKQLADRLLCSQDAPSSHVLQSPVSTPCCGLALCKSCIDAHLTHATKRQAKHEGEIKSDDNCHNGVAAPEDAAAPVTCKCGRPMDAAEIDRLREAPVNRALQSLTEWLRQLETGGSTAESIEASFKVQLTPPPPAESRSISANAGKSQQAVAQEPPVV